MVNIGFRCPGTRTMGTKQRQCMTSITVLSAHINHASAAVLE